MTVIACVLFAGIVGGMFATVATANKFNKWTDDEEFTVA